MVGVLVRAISILDNIEKIRDLLKTQAVFDSTFVGKKLVASPQMGNKVQFFSNYEPTNYIADLSQNQPNQVFAIATGNIFRSQYDNQLYIQAQLTRKIKSGYLNDWDNEIVFVRALDVLTTQTTAKKSNSSGLLILGLIGFLLLSK